MGWMSSSIDAASSSRGSTVGPKGDKNVSFDKCVLGNSVGGGLDAV